MSVESIGDDISLNMNEKPYNNLWELFEAIRSDKNTNGNNIILLDDPKRLLIGWKCDDNYHYVRISSIRSRSALALPFKNDSLYDLLTDLIITMSGRQKIANILNSNSNSVLECFDRMLKLKAFW